MLHHFKFRQTIKEGRPLLGTIQTLNAPEVTEIIAAAGFDWLFVDVEHSTLDIAQAQRLLQAAGNLLPCVVRSPNHEEMWIKKILDIGAAGILFPRVNSAAEAERIVQYCKYSPLGSRSVGVARAHGYGATFCEYVEKANQDIAVIVQIEDIAAVNNIESIVAVPGIDALFIGPYDLSASMGMPGRVTAPEVKAQIEKVLHVGKAANQAVGIFTMDPNTVNDLVQKGYSLICSGIDTAVLTLCYTDNIKRMRTAKNLCK